MPVTTGGTEARLVLPPEASRPGRYMIQVNTTEQILFPVRRCL